MCDEYITAKHIEKLSHHIPEIRERALLNIYSKLQRGIYYDNDLARSKELFWQLCNWFRENEPPMRHDEIVTKMLKRIVKSETGIYLIDLHCLQELVKEFNELKSIVDESGQCHLAEIVKYLEDVASAERNPNVPPLNLDALNSCRSVGSGDDVVSLAKDDVGTTATTIAGFVDSFASLDVADNNNIHKTIRTLDPLENPFRHYTFLWQWLIGADRHVLESVESTLRNPSEPSELLNSFEFITDVLLHDFPAEVFLQRPAIVKQLHDLLWSSPSSRITTAILKCLGKLTKEFVNRIRYYDNPGTHNLKLNNFHIDVTTPETTTRDAENDDSSSADVETIAETSNLMKHQMNVPQFCLNTINAIFDYLHVSPEAGDSFRRKKCQIGINAALVLLWDAINLLKMAVKSCIFTAGAKNGTNVGVTLNKFEETFKKYGEVLTYFRIKVLSEDFNEETRLVQMHLLKNFVHLYSDFLPAGDFLLPANLKHALCETLLDASLSRLFPSLHRSLYDLSRCFQTDDTYEDVLRVCASMTASIKFLRDWKSLPFTKNVSLVEESLVSLEFHRNLHLVSTFIDILANKLTTHTFDEEILDAVEGILLKLMSHREMPIRIATYKNCHARVAKTIGAKLNVSKSSAPGSQILFLLRGRILSLIATQGLADESDEVQGYAEDVLVHLLKAKLLVSEEIWRETVTALMPSMPVLLAHAHDAKSLIGRHVLALLDPDRCRMMNFSVVEVLRLNVGLLFGGNGEVRMEAASRLCWLLSNLSQAPTPSSGGGQAKEVRMLPHLNNLHDKVLADVCLIDRKVDFKGFRGTQTHFYQPSSLHQVLDLLSSASAVEPVIRRSAITQVGVMMEDPLLHSVFLERDGLEIIKNSMRSALTDEEYRDYPDSAIPCLAILKNLCLYSASVRQTIANSEELLHLILRGMFMFCAEPRVKQDGGVLLFLVVFNEYVRGSPVKNDLCVASVLQEALKCPFEAKNYLSSGDYALPALKHLKENKWAFASLQIHWNIEYFHGLDAILQPNLTYTFENMADKFSDELKLSATDLRAVKSTSIQFTINKCLENVYQSHCHEIIRGNLHLLTRCISLYEITEDSISMDLDAFEWEKSFARYLNAPPADQQDNILLSVILDFFALLLPHLHPQNTNYAWIVSMITSRTHYFNVLLAVELSREQEQDVEKLLNSLLNLIDVCAIGEQKMFDRHSGGDALSAKPSSVSLQSQQTQATHHTTTTTSTTTSQNSSSKYSHIVKTLVNNLQCSNAKHFYNLAYLDRLLKTLTHLTATFGWSDSKFGGEIKKTLKQLASSAFELLNAFHCGKGPTAADSLMGLSITRNVVFVLNHLVAEMQHFGIKEWEECFADCDGEVESAYRAVFALKNSRDVVLRAAAVHLLSGLAMSPRCAVQMIEDIAVKRDYLHLWKISLAILCDHEESAVVRENAAQLLTNLTSHGDQQDGGEICLARGLLIKQKTQVGGEILPDSQKKVLVALLDSCNFFKEVEVILKRLQTDKVFNFFELRGNTNSDIDDFMFVYNKVLEVSNASDSLNPHHATKSAQKFENAFGITTPGVIRALATFVYNLVCILPQTISRALQTMGLIKLFFKCVTLPNIQIENVRDLMSYADLLQMNTAICVLLTKTAETNENCLLTIGNARDCLDLLTALLDPAIYVVSLPELHYLRNKLWSSVFDLIDILLCGCNSLNDKYDSNALIMQLESRKEQFLLSLCESIRTDVSNDLQLSALNSLTSLLKCNETQNNPESPEENENSPQLSNLPSSRSIKSSGSSVRVLLDHTKTPRVESAKQLCQPSSDSKFDLLREIYFGNGLKSRRSRSSLSLSSLTSEEENLKETRMAGAKLCKILLDLYESLNLQKSAASSTSMKPHIKRKTIVLNTLTSLLLVSTEAKHFALERGLVAKILNQLQTIYVQLSLENVDVLRKVSEKKRLNPVLQDLEALIGLMMNFLYGSEDVKTEAAQLGLTDLLHKLWHWFAVHKGLHITALKLLCTLTTDCPSAAASLALTSNTPGSGPRKTPSNASLLHVVCALITKEMDSVSRTHSLETLRLCFHVMHNAVAVQECRGMIVKGSFLSAVSKLHPALSKRQKPWEQVELLWLEFLSEFSAFPEGQAVVGKVQDVFEIVLCMCACPNVSNRMEALQVLRNIAFYQGNRARLLASDDFLNILSTRLSASIPEEVAIVVPAIWALAANSQKAKMVFKAAKFDAKIKDYLRVSYLNNYANVSDEEAETLRYVLGMLSQNS